MPCAAGYAVNQIRASACEVLLACIRFPCYGAGYFPTPILAWTISAFFLFAGILNEMWGCSNFIMGDGWCGALTGVSNPTEQLFMIKMFDIPLDLKKSVMRTCLVDFWSVCGKDSVWAFGRSITK